MHPASGEDAAIVRGTATHLRTAAQVRGVLPPSGNGQARFSLAAARVGAERQLGRSMAPILAAMATAHIEPYCHLPFADRGRGV